MVKTVLALACASLCLLAAGPASATNKPPKCKAPALQFFGDDTGIIAWQKPRLDSPLDPNNSRLGIHVLNQDGDDYAGAYNDCTGIEKLLVGQVRNLSFDFLNQTGNPDVHVGAGAPRISVDLDTDGDGSTDAYAYLSAYYCQVPLAENPRWSRSDFTGRVLAGCGFYTSFGGPYESDGVSSAWSVFAAAFPNARVNQAYLVMDEPGTAFVDRLAFHNKMFQQAGTGSAAVKTCASESVC